VGGIKSTVHPAQRVPVTLVDFIKRLNTQLGIALPADWQLLSDVQISQRFLKEINKYFYQTSSGIGVTEVGGETFQYFSEFHRFWQDHHREILNPRINSSQAKKAAEGLSRAVRQFGTAILSVTHETHGLPSAAMAQVRFFTANQDFREPPKDPYGKYLEDATRFDPGDIYNDPEGFLKFIGATKLSQNDKRIDFAKNAAGFLLENGIDAFQIAAKFGNDAVAVREALIGARNMGYGAKKANMFIRDMAELKVWGGLSKYEQIDVASDINTMKLALRARILETDIPLLSSFLDIFCYQYGCIDEMSAQAWRAVWEEWRKIDESTAPGSPCELDFLLYRIGREYCKDNLFEYECEFGHCFFWFGGSIRRCTVCNKKNRGKATPLRRMLPCQVELAQLPQQDGSFLIPDLLRLFGGMCIFEQTCDPKNPEFTIFDPPKSISIKGQTSWTNSMARRERGGGGMMG
jgi:hypothetical protein